MSFYKKKMLVVTYPSGRVERLLCKSGEEERNYKDKLKGIAARISEENLK